jgi:hypothetical protein
MKTNTADVKAEMQAIVRMAAEPRLPGDNTKGAIRRAAAALQLTYRRAYSLWYSAERAKVRADEAERLRAEAHRLRLLRIERLEREIAELRAEVRRQDALAEAEGGRRHSVADGVGAAHCSVAGALNCGAGA